MLNSFVIKSRQKSIEVLLRYVCVWGNCASYFILMMMILVALMVKNNDIKFSLVMFLKEWH